MRNIWWLPGTALIVFGILIIVYPQLLAYFVATAFIGSGLSMIAAGRLFRQAANTRSGTVISYRMASAERQERQDPISYE